MTDLHTFASSLYSAAADMIAGDQSTRHDGAKRFVELCDSVKIFELLAEFDRLSQFVGEHG